MPSPNAETLANVLAALVETAAPQYQDILDDALERIQYVRNRTRERDFDSVLHAIRMGALTARDIAAETKISIGHTCFLLRRLTSAKKIGFNLKKSGEPGRSVKVFFLRALSTRKK